MNTVNDGLYILDSEIEKLRQELQKYAILPNAKPEYIKRQNKLIEELCNAYNSFDFLKFSELWVWMEHEFSRLEHLDPELSGFYIVLRMKPTGNNFSFIKINPFDR